MKKVSGQYIDILNRIIFAADVYIEAGKISKIEKVDQAPQRFILPGFIDAHIHIESSMLTPSQFALEAVRHGTIATVSDPHEIANVCGMKGVAYMLDNAKQVPFKFHFGAPSCVPATNFESAGAVIDSKDIAQLMQRSDIYYLSEVMNFPAVINEDSEMMKKLEAAKAVNKPIDGHAPGVQASDMHAYFSKGISTDHECVALDEAKLKIAHGCKILIREGSAAKNFDALIDLFQTNPSSLMFCSDDLHPDDLIEGHINLLVKRAMGKGFDLFDVLYAACVHPVTHYQLPVGTLDVGAPADFIIVKDTHSFEVVETWINGEVVYKNNQVQFSVTPASILNNFESKEKAISDFELRILDSYTSVKVKTIVALDGQLITENSTAVLPIINGVVCADSSQDVLKIVVVNRYFDAPVSIAFIKNFGLKNAAIGSTVAHDSHNIVVVGTDDELICKAVNTLIESKGGICFVNNQEVDILSLPIAGLMSDDNAKFVGQQYQKLTSKAKDAGSQLKAPFMALSFMALPVIPFLKITDKGLFDVGKFDFTDLIEL